MTALPLIERDLRVKSRRWGTYWLRAGVGLVGVLVCVPQLISSTNTGLTQDIGKEVFDALVAALFFVSCGACLLSSDAIGLERREGTLSLLLLTRVRGMDVLIGKFGSSAVAGACAMAAFLPVLALPILAGGLTGGEALRKGLALLNTLFFALASGLYASSVQREQTKAAALALFIVLAFTLAPWLFWVSTPLSRSNAIGPLVATICAGDARFSSDTVEYYVSMFTVQALAWALLGRTAATFGRVLRNCGMGEPIHQTVQPGIENPHVRPVPAKSWRQVQSDPIGWAVKNQRGIRAPIWWATAIVVVYVLLAQRTFYSSTTAWLFYGVCSAGTDALLAVAAGRFFVENARSGRLELLLTTPVGAKTIVESQWRAFKIILGWPVAIWIAALMLHSTAWLSLWDLGSSHATFSWASKYAITWFFDIVGTILGVFLVCWVGMYVGLRTQSRLAIAGWAAALSTGVPALFRLLFGIIVDPILTQAASGPASSGVLLSMWIEQTLLLIYCAYASRFLRRRLTRELKGGSSTNSLIVIPGLKRLRGQLP